MLRFLHISNHTKMYYILNVKKNWFEEWFYNYKKMFILWLQCNSKS